jgi:D-3-phosphoglycerate dehydrogenase
MEVVGFDPYISVEAAWNLSRTVRRAESLDELLSKADYITLHLPLSDATKNTIGEPQLSRVKKGARLLNLARGGLVDEAAVIRALHDETLSCYVTDFCSPDHLKEENVVATPHLGASTPEAEENCAMMAVRQTMDFLEAGNIINSVNFPKCHLEKNAGLGRILVVNRNIPNMVGQITTMLASLHINITDLINHHRDDYAYNIIDTEQVPPPEIVSRLAGIDGVVKVRML